MMIELTCPFCTFSKKVPKEKIPVTVKWATCPRCRQKFEIFGSRQSHGQGESQIRPNSEFQDKAEKESERRDVPWENRLELGIIQGIFQTIKGVLFSPDAFFSTMRFSGGIKEPLAFGLLLGSIGAMFGFFWQFLIVSGGMLSFGESIFGEISFLMIFLIFIFIIPCFVTMSIFLQSSILHLSLLIVKGGNNGFEATFRVISYSQAVRACSIIPIIGGWIAWLWYLIVEIIGLREIHKISYLRLFLAFSIPVLFIFLLILAAAIIIFTLIGRHQFGQLWS